MRFTIAIVGALTLAPGIRGQTTFVDVGVVNGPPGYARPTGLSGDGSVAVGTSGSVGGFGDYNAFRWTENGGIVDIGNLPGQLETVKFGRSGRVKDSALEALVAGPSVEVEDSP